jgi:tRNA 2-thiouridine synthesizing protein C
VNVADTGKKTLVVIRHTPYGSSLARAALDAAMAMAAFEQAVDILFLGDGVLHLMPDQDGAAIGVNNVGKLLASLPLYDIDSVYVDAASAAKYRITTYDTPIAGQFLDQAQIQQLLSRNDHLLGF